MFPGVDPDNPGWTFEKEVSKVKKFKAYMDGHMDHDETFNLHSRGHPDNIEDSFFPMLVKGKVPKSRQELEELVEALKQTGLSTPTFSRSIWKVSMWIINTCVLCQAGAWQGRAFMLSLSTCLADYQ